MRPISNPRPPATLALAALLAALLPASARAAGESVAGFPNYRERVFHQLANRARVDPQLELQNCGPNCSEAVCYGPTAPLFHSEALNRAARFHADEMAKQGFFAHASVCTVVDGIAGLYPDGCDGGAACACVGGVSQCMPACSTAQERVQKWSVAYGGEIIISSVTPETAFYAWLFEDAKGVAECGFHIENAHRFLLLQGGDAVGFGAASGYTVGDFGSPGAQHKLASGTHWPREGPTVEVWASWYDFAGGPMQARVNVDGACVDMQLARGTVDNGAFTVTLDGLAPGCHRYYFQFTDAMGSPVTYPTAGSLAIGPEDGCPDFSDARPADCDCVPNCNAAACGDDGCGGSCGECVPGDVCVDGMCVVVGCDPFCFEGDACGPDGCGGFCGTCSEGQECVGGLCAPLGGTGPEPTTGADATTTTTGGGVGSTGGPAASDTGTGSEEAGCGCRGAPAASAWWALLLFARPRRRRPAQRTKTASTSATPS